MSTDPKALVQTIIADFQEDKNLHGYKWEQEKPVYSPGT